MMSRTLPWALALLVTTTTMHHAEASPRTSELAQAVYDQVLRTAWDLVQPDSECMMVSMVTGPLFTAVAASPEVKAQAASSRLLQRSLSTNVAYRHLVQDMPLTQALVGSTFYGGCLGAMGCTERVTFLDARTARVDEYTMGEREDAWVSKRGSWTYDATETLIKIQYDQKVKTFPLRNTKLGFELGGDETMTGFTNYRTDICSL